MDLLDNGQELPNCIPLGMAVAHHGVLPPRRKMSGVLPIVQSSKRSSFQPCTSGENCRSS